MLDKQDFDLQVKNASREVGRLLKILREVGR